VEVEHLCAAHRDRGGAVSVVRPFTVGGERQRPDMALARFLRAAAAGRPIELLGSPLTRRDITDVRDVVHGLIAIVETGHIGTVNLGTGVAHTLADVVAHVVAAVGRPIEIVRKPAHPHDVPVTLAGTSRCADVLGFTPSTDLPALIARQATLAGASGAGRRAAR
jgi:nucleoside-diphosphate-sugar epimerase